MLTEIQSLGKSLFPQGHSPQAPQEFEPHLRGAVEWLWNAHRGASEHGLSKGYDTLRGRWNSPYPETTGYTIPTLLNASGYLEDPGLRALALRLADYVLEVMGKDGGVSHWASEKHNPIVFDTGQVLFGLLAAHKATGNPVFLEAATRAGNWLVSVQDSGGSWKRGQHLGVEKTIDTRVAWALLRLHAEVPEGKYQSGAIQCLEWVLTQQDLDGWFRRCSFTTQEDPFTHTLCYTAEGLLECGKLLGEERYVSAAKITSAALLDLQEHDGSLCSTFAAGWKASSHSSCLTGNCQAAKLWLDFFELDGRTQYFAAAQRALAFVASRQTLRPSLPGIHGGIPGSSPFFGTYERFKYPNWAAKFFIDAVLTLERVHAYKPEFAFVG
ncbi:MAG: glycoside hydrolase family 127 protein [Bdellovibrionales bacterium]|nr:glycoside hydrolase family 127 protein [Bdellovibrionales bacterium]